MTNKPYILTYRVVGDGRKINSTCHFILLGESCNSLELFKAHENILIHVHLFFTITFFLYNHKNHFTFALDFNWMHSCDNWRSNISWTLNALGRRGWFIQGWCFGKNIYGFWKIEFGTNKISTVHGLIMVVFTWIGAQENVFTI